MKLALHLGFTVNLGHPESRVLSALGLSRCSAPLEGFCRSAHGMGGSVWCQVNNVFPCVYIGVSISILWAETEFIQTHSTDFKTGQPTCYNSQWRPT